MTPHRRKFLQARRKQAIGALKFAKIWQGASGEIPIVLSFDGYSKVLNHVAIRSINGA